MSLTIHCKYNYFDSTVQRTEDRRKKFHFCRLQFAVNVMLNLSKITTRVQNARTLPPFSLTTRLFTIYPKNPEISDRRKMERLILSPRTKIFSGKRGFLKGRPKFPNGISEWKSAFQLLVLIVPGLLAWIAFHPIFREKVVEMDRAHPTENFRFEF